MGNGSPDYTRRSILYAWNGTAFVPVLVDSEGNIVSVFKGDYSDTLQTVKVDSEGRIIALITDELDIYKNKIVVGNAELAVRLGSEKFFDRRGDVFFIDGFENGLNKWTASGDGTGHAQEITAERVRSGGYSLKLTGGKTDPYESYIYTYFPYPILSKWGLEAHFCMPVDFDKLYFGIRKQTSTHKIHADILYDHTNQKLQYRDIDGVYQDLATSFTLLAYAELFQIIKLVADLENDKYHRLIINDVEYPVSTYDMYSEPDGGAGHIYIEILLISVPNQNDYIYLDNIILTQNEP